MTVIIGLSEKRGEGAWSNAVGTGWGRRRTDDYGGVPLLRLGVVVGLRRANGALARLGGISISRSCAERDMARRVLIVGSSEKGG